MGGRGGEWWVDRGGSYWGREEWWVDGGKGGGVVGG